MLFSTGLCVINIQYVALTAFSCKSYLPLFIDMDFTFKEMKRLEFMRSFAFDENFCLGFLKILTVYIGITVTIGHKKDFFISAVKKIGRLRTESYFGNGLRNRKRHVALG